METKGYNAISIANYFIELSIKKNGCGLYLLPLIKLPYIAHGFTLAITKEPLCCDPVVAWRYGPVYTRIYHTFKFGPLRKDHSFGWEKEPKFEETHKRIMNHTFKIYGRLNSAELSALTHQKGTPWFDTEMGEQIKDADIQIYYEKLLNKLAPKK